MTKEIEYIKSQPWGLEFVKELVNNTSRSGKSLIDIVYWDNTAKGIDYWYNIDNSLPEYFRKYYGPKDTEGILKTFQKSNPELFV